MKEKSIFLRFTLGYVKNFPERIYNSYNPLLSTKTVENPVESV